MIDREVLTEHFKYALRSMSLTDFAGLFVNEASALEAFYKLQHGVKDGKMISLLFNPHRLDTATITNPISIYQSLQQENLLSGLARMYLYNLEHGINDPFFCAIQRGFNGIQYVNEFPPHVAREIVQTYSKVKTGEKIRVLDPCAGWGGRMIGVASLGNTEYFAFEPCTQTFQGLCKLSDWITTLEPKFKSTVHCKPYEDFDGDEKEFDIALTSPPYYDTEHYSDEETNSMNRYHSFDEWCEKFYEPLIMNTIARVKKDGVFIINVGSRKYPLESKLYEICEKNGLFCEKLTKNYLSGTGEGKESFYCISRVKMFTTQNRLFDL